MKYLLSLGLIVLLSNPFDSFAQDALYSNADFKEILESYDEIIVVMNGFDYKYTGNWTNTMEISGNHALSFTRGKVTHSFDLTKVVFVQEEGNYVKLWFKH
ncbi:hypothetical protein OAE48_05070 [Flavobacteriales bacterium]|nr:hypothetical protein [Flavobacteriales bacterium]